MRRFHGYKREGLQIQRVSWVEMERREGKKDKSHTWSRGSRPWTVRERVQKRAPGLWVGEMTGAGYFVG